MSTELIRDLGEVIARHPEVSGREFQRAALTAAEGLYEPADLDELVTPQAFADALVEALERLPVLS